MTIELHRWNCLCLLLLPVAMILYAESQELAPGLVLIPPSNMTLRYEKVAVLDDTPTLVGYIDGQPAYFIAAETVDPATRNRVLWTKLETSIRDKSDNQQFILSASGGYKTLQGHSVHYRLYSYSKDGRTHQQAFHLVKSTSSGFWVYVTAIEPVDVQALLAFLKPVLRRMQIPEG